MFVTIQSYGRPENVERMESALYPLKPTWVVPEHQKEEYAKHSSSVIGIVGKSHPMKTEQLNYALDVGFANNQLVVTMDDDYEKTLTVDTEGKGHQISLPDFIEILANKLINSPYYVSGVTPTHNPFYCKNVTTNYGMMTGQLLVHKKNDIRFDDEMKMIEDIDYFLAHHLTHKGVVKSHDMIAKFDIISPDRKKPYTGGFEKQRTKEVQQKCINYLKQKYKNPNIAFDDDMEVGTNLIRKVKWKKLIQDDENNLESFFND